MFAPNPPRAAAEMLRVCRPGGKIGLANWTPDGFIGQVFKTIGKHVPPPAGVQLAGAVGHARAHRRAVRRAGRRRSTCRRAQFMFRYRSAEHIAECSAATTARCSRPSPRSTTGAQAALAKDLMALMGRFNRASDGTMVAPSDYLEIVITRR